MLYFRGQNFNEQVAESRRKHVPLFFGVEAYADDASNFYRKGKLNLWLTAGELNKCRKLDVDDSMMRRMGAGHLFRYTSVDEKTYGKTRYMMKLWYHPTTGYHTKSQKNTEGRTSTVFDIPEAMLEKWLVPDEKEYARAADFAMA